MLSVATLSCLNICSSNLQKANFFDFIFFLLFYLLSFDFLPPVLSSHFNLFYRFLLGIYFETRSRNNLPHLKKMSFISPPDFTDGNWIDRGTYWLSIYPQSDPHWSELKKKHCLLTSSDFGTAIGHNRFTSPDQLADHIAGISPKQFTEENLRVMSLGNKFEPVTRSWYRQTYSANVQEVGLAIPKWDPEIGCSIDGEILPNGMIEIKCPESMYKPILSYTSALSLGWKAPPSYSDHIWKTHYAQMQGCMAIMNKQWCDYIVHGLNDRKIFVQRIPFNQEYWSQTLYPGIRKFIEEKLKPRLRQRETRSPHLSSPSSSN